MKHRFLSLVTALFSCVALWAQQPSVNSGLQFEATADGECCVTKSPGASGKIVVPSSVVIDNATLSVTSVAAEAFADNQAIEAVVLPDGLTEIGRRAFFNCQALTTVVLGAATSEIASQAFDRSTSLTDINCRAQNPPLTGTYVFDSSIYSSATLTVPEGRRAPYEASSVWGRFSNIVENDLTGEDVALTISLPSGTVTTIERYGTAVALSLLPDEGWELYSVEFNGENCLSDVSADGQITTPRLTADSRLNAVFTKTGGLTASGAEHPLIAADGSALIVRADSMVTVCSPEGTVLYCGPAGRIETGRRGPVIVIVGTEIFKLSL